MFRHEFRRRKDGQTDYRQRLKLLDSGKTRVVIRRSLNNYRVQFVSYQKCGDATIASAISKELEKFGWNRHGGNLGAAYLTGLLAGLRAKEKVKDCVLDIGLHISTKGCGLYAALKGVLDAGIGVQHGDEVLPPMERIGRKQDKDFNELFERVKEKIANSVGKDESGDKTPKKSKKQSVE